MFHDDFLNILRLSSKYNEGQWMSCTHTWCDYEVPGIILLCDL